MKNSFKNTLKLTLCAVLAGLSFVAMYLGNITGVFDLCAVVVGALCMAFAVIEFGGVWPWLVCFVTSVLSLVLLPDKMVALEYIFLGGIYPILKRVFENRGRIISLILKAVYCNVALTVVIVLIKFVFVTAESSAMIVWLIYLIGNAFFFIFDYSLTTFITFYLLRLRKKLRIKDMH
ncbi:MAG: hypothetical protein IJ389_00770 [Clostridia bacterium]|nr:hypothetical protein [Clostridia bacterium]